MRGATTFFRPLSWQAVAFSAGGDGGKSPDLLSAFRPILTIDRRAAARGGRGKVKNSAAFSAILKFVAVPRLIFPEFEDAVFGGAPSFACQTEAGGCILRLTHHATR
jgi:hypothetical protein